MWEAAMDAGTRGPHCYRTMSDRISNVRVAQSCVSGVSGDFGEFPSRHAGAPGAPGMSPGACVESRCRAVSLGRGDKDISVIWWRASTGTRGHSALPC